MSHPFCITGEECNSAFPAHGWSSWNGKSIYVKVFIDDSVRDHKQECGEALARWNDLVGSRFFLNPDKGTGGVRIDIYERDGNEYPFNRWSAIGKSAWGVCVNYDINGNPLGDKPGKILRSEVYVNRSVDSPRLDMYHNWVHVFAHEIGHAFGLADHPTDGGNTVMSYENEGMLLLAPSYEDQRGIEKIYGLKDLMVRPEDLEGIENIQALWHYDRYGMWRLFQPGQWQRWRFWFPGFSSASSIKSIKLNEVYLVKPKKEGLLGFGRYSGPVSPELAKLSGGSHRWAYR